MAEFDKLAAVNLLLDSIGEDPVSSLASGLPDAEKAERFLDRTSREVQSLGWHTNTDRETTLVRDVNNRIAAPSTMLRVDTVGWDRGVNVTVRDLNGTKYLYDLKNKVYTFTRDLKCDVVWLYDFDDLPFSMKNFIAYKAAVEYQKSEIASQTMDVMLARTMEAAYAVLADAEVEAEDHNPLLKSPSLAWTTYRNSRIRGG